MRVSVLLRTPPSFPLIFTPRPLILFCAITVLEVTEYGCVGESMYGVSVVVSECSAKVGDVVSASFYIPAMEVNGFYDKVQERVMAVQP